MINEFLYNLKRENIIQYEYSNSYSFIRFLKMKNRIYIIRTNNKNMKSFINYSRFLYNINLNKIQNFNNLIYIKNITKNGIFIFVYFYKLFLILYIQFKLYHNPFVI